MKRVDIGERVSRKKTTTWEPMLYT